MASLGEMDSQQLARLSRARSRPENDWPNGIPPRNVAKGLDVSVPTIPVSTAATKGSMIPRRNKICVFMKRSVVNNQAF